MSCTTLLQGQSLRGRARQRRGAVLQAAERLITADLEALIAKTVDTTKATYAVVAGVQIHSWPVAGERGPALEYVSRPVVSRRLLVLAGLAGVHAAAGSRALFATVLGCAAAQQRPVNLEGLLHSTCRCVSSLHSCVPTCTLASCVHPASTHRCTDWGSAPADLAPEDVRGRERPAQVRPHLLLQLVDTWHALHALAPWICLMWQCRSRMQHADAAAACPGSWD